MHSDRYSFYQFLYVSRGNHVVGASIPFRVFNEPDLDEYNLDTLFAEELFVRCTSRAYRRKGKLKNVTAAYANYRFFLQNQN